MPTGMFLYIFIIYNLAVPCLWVRFTRRVLTPKAGILGSPLATYLVFTATNYSFLVLYTQLYIKMAVVVFVFFAIFHLLYLKDRGRFFLVSAMLSFSIMAPEFIAVVLLISIFSGESILVVQNTPHLSVLLLLLTSLLAFLFLEASAFFLQKRTVELPSKYLLRLTLIPISQLIVISYYGQATLFERSGPMERKLLFFILLLLLVFFVTDYLMLYLAKNLVSSNKKRVLNDLILAEKKNLVEKYQSLEAHQSKVKKLRHDMHNHIGAVEALLEGSSTGEALSYCYSLKETYAEPGE